MPRVLTVFPNRPDTTQRVKLGDRVLRVRLRWFRRLAAWFVDVHDVDGADLVVGRRASPGWPIPDGLRPPGWPAGRLVVRGEVDPYDQVDLGTRVAIVWIDDAEIPALATPDDGVRFAPVA